jgi:hypothetical protein
MTKKQLVEKPLTQGRLRELLSYDPETGAFTWLVSLGRRVRVGDVAGTFNGRYWAITVNKRIYMAHRLAWLYVYGSFPKYELDHINGDKIDNRIVNLRDVTGQVNRQNLHRPNRGKATIGTFPTASEAHAAYLTAKRVQHPGNTL